VKWFCRRNRACFLVAWVVALAAGVGLIVGAAAMVAGGQKSTTGEHYWDRLKLYYANDFPDFNDTTVTSIVTTAATEAAVANFVHVSTPVSWSLVGPNGTDVRTFQQMALVGTIPRNTRGNGVIEDMIVTLELQQGSVTSSFSTLPIPYQFTPGGARIDQACFVIEHTAHGGPWQQSGTYPFCNVPFDDAKSSASYGDPARRNHPVVIVILSSYNPALWLKAQSNGNLNQVPDTEVLLVDPNMPTLLGLGCALLVAGAVLLPYFCCCVVPPEADEVAPWEVEAGQVAVEAVTTGAPIEGFADVAKTDDEASDRSGRSSRASDPKAKSRRSGAYSEKSETTDDG